MDQKQLNRELLQAAKRGDTKSVEDLVARGANVNCKPFGRSPLYLAAEQGHTETVSRLVELGVDVNIKTDLSGESPLHRAAAGGHTETVSRLVELGGDVNVKDWLGQTPYDVADNDDIRELLKKALEHGVHKSDKDDPLTRIEDAATFKALLSVGTYESYGNRIYLAGACKVGKSTLASLLIGDEIPLTWKSTDGLKIFFGRNGIDLKELKMVPLKKGQGDRDVLTHVLRGHPDMKKDSTKMDVASRSSDEAAYQSGIADFTSSKPGQSSTGRVPSQTSSLEHKSPRIEFLEIHENIKAEIRKGKYKVHIAPSDLVDFGGQKSYDMTHQLFIQGKGTFTLIFDGRKRLQEPLKEEYPAGDVTTESILKHWVDSILTYCGVDDEDVLPVILFVATHRDCISNKEGKIQEFKEGLSTIFQNHERVHRIMYTDIFFINGTDRNDPEVERLKAKYVDLARKQKSWGKRIPMAWVPLELQLSALRENNTSLISKEELEKLNEGNGDLKLKGKELEQFLKEQHSLGKIMYYQGQGLDKYIVVQPTSVVDILRSFITDETFFPPDKYLAQILKEVTKTGKITKKDLFRLWSQAEFNQHMPNNDSKEFVVNVLVHLDLLVEPKSGKAQRNFFLVPCMVKQKATEGFIKDLRSDKSLFMSYKLSKSIPSALSFKLIGAILNVWPLKETNEGICLYHKAAILDINEENELRILGNDDRIVVCLVNKTAKGFISPDIASCVQECLTLAMETALEFYHNSFGKIVSSSKISSLLQTEVGEKCETGICYISLTAAKTVKFWRCKARKDHKTEKLLYWSYDTKQDSCTEQCTGLDETSLSAYVSEQHLVRLAGKITMEKCMTLVIQLGLPIVQRQHIYEQERDVMMSIFTMLCKWKMYVTGRGSKPTFKMLNDALIKDELNSHLLCEIFREYKPLLEIQAEILQQMPDNNTLQELSRKIGNCALRLGVELGLETVEIEKTIQKYNKDIFEQNYDILTKWSKSGSYKLVESGSPKWIKSGTTWIKSESTKCINSGSNTLRSLMQALQIVDPRGLEFLDTKYNIGLFKVT